MGRVVGFVRGLSRGIFGSMGEWSSVNQGWTLPASELARHGGKAGRTNSEPRKNESAATPAPERKQRNPRLNTLWSYAILSYKIQSERGEGARVVLYSVSIKIPSMSKDGNPFHSRRDLIAEAEVLVERRLLRRRC